MEEMEDVEEADSGQRGEKRPAQDDDDEMGLSHLFLENPEYENKNQVMSVLIDEDDLQELPLPPQEELWAGWQYSQLAELDPEKVKANRSVERERLSTFGV